MQYTSIVLVPHYTFKLHSDFQWKSDTQNTLFPLEINSPPFSLKKRKCDTDWEGKYPS